MAQRHSSYAAAIAAPGDSDLKFVFKTFWNRQWSHYQSVTTQEAISELCLHKNCFKRPLGILNLHKHFDKSNED